MEKVKQTRLKRNVKKLIDNTCIKAYDIRYISTLEYIRIDLKYLKNIDLKTIEKVIESINDNKHCDFNLYYKRLILK